MNFENKLSTKKEVVEVSESEREKMLNIEKEINEALDKIKKVNLFEEQYINEMTLVIFDDGTNEPVHKFNQQNIDSVSGTEDYSFDDFKKGKRTDFVWMIAKKDLEKWNIKALESKQILQAYFFENGLTYEESIVHEMAHNIVDIKYKKENGEYEEDKANPELTDVSDEYREEMKEKILSLLKKKYPNIDTDEFVFDRQQIVEIPAFLAEREFCRRSGSNIEMHEELDRRADIFCKNPEEFIEKINQKDKKKFDIESSLYLEDHVLSFLVAKLLEEEYPDFEERMNIF